MQSVAFIERLQTKPVLRVQVLLHKWLVVSIAVPSSEPFRLSGHNGTILIPHPQSEVVQGADAGLVTFIFDLLLVVQLRQEDRVLIEFVEPEIGTEVVGRGEPVLDPDQFREVAECVVDERAVPVVALVINTDATMRRAICK